MENLPTEELTAWNPDGPGISRRQFLLLGTATMMATIVCPPAMGEAPAVALEAGDLVAELPVLAKVALQVNGQARALEIDTRTTLLDALREHLHLTGAKRAATTASAAPARFWSTVSASTPASPWP